MPTIVSLALRDGELLYEDVDLDVLSPRARVMAEAVASRTLRTRGVIWCASRDTVRELVADAAQWYREDQLDGPLYRPWEGWAHYPADSAMTPVHYLETQARKIPAQYVIFGTNPHDPAPSSAESAPDKGMTRSDVLTYLREHGRPISPSTWTSYVARGQAPKPARYVSRTPLWDLDQVKAFAGEPVAT